MWFLSPCVWWLLFLCGMFPEVVDEVAVQLVLVEELVSLVHYLLIAAALGLRLIIPVTLTSPSSFSLVVMLSVAVVSLTAALFLAVCACAVVASISAVAIAHVLMHLSLFFLFTII